MKWLSNTLGANAMNNAQANTTFNLFHKGLALIYLCAFIPMFFELDVLLGVQGFQPAQLLLKTSYSDQCVMASVLQCPSRFHLSPNNVMLTLITSLGCIGALGLLLGFQIFWSSILAWISFLSITTIGGDFYIIIIDLFLAEVGFLTLFSTYYLQYKNYIPNIVATAFKLLNFKLWFSMGVIKFYMPLSTWTDFTFFDTFFQAQPMPTPMAKLFHQTPNFFKILAIVLLFLGEIIAPFFVFGNRLFRIFAGITFILISVLIQINGNYGYFNVLSIVLVIPIFKSSDLGLIEKAKLEALITGKNKWVKGLLIPQLIGQIAYCILLFHPKPMSYQNHFNFIHTYIKSDAHVVNTITYPIRLMAYWRICNPYGVFKGIPKYHGEVRISGSINGKDWQNYEFKYLPSGVTDYLGYYAPYYPRLDHLMFYETLSETNSKHNTLNPYYKNIAPWSTQFIKQLFEEKPLVNKLLQKNPFENNGAPILIKTTLFQLKFSPQKYQNWIAQKPCFEKIYTIDSALTSTLIPYDVALKNLSD